MTLFGVLFVHLERKRQCNSVDFLLPCFTMGKFVEKLQAYIDAFSYTHIKNRPSAMIADGLLIHIVCCTWFRITISNFILKQDD